MRQFLQKEAKEVREHAQALISLSMLDKTNNLNNKTNLPINGIEGALIELLNIETDKEICQFIKVLFNYFFFFTLINTFCLIYRNAFYFYCMQLAVIY